MIRILTLAFFTVLASAALHAQDRPADGVVEIKIERSLGADSAGVADLLPATDADRFVLSYFLLNDSRHEMAIGRVEISEQVNCQAKVASGPGSRVAAGGTTNMVIEVSPEDGGLISFTVSIMVDDRTYTYPVHGTVTTLLHPGHRHRNGDHHCSTGGGASWLLIAGAAAMLGTLALRRRKA